MSAATRVSVSSDHIQTVVGVCSAHEARRVPSLLAVRWDMPGGWACSLTGGA